MFILRPTLTLLCATSILGAQSPVDLNSLAMAAKRYASHGLQGQQFPATLDLREMKGDNGGNPNFLMMKATDVQRWTVFYNTSYKTPSEDEIVRPKSASLKCVQGVFSDFFMSPQAIPDCKSIEFTWLAVPLDGAIAHLNALGFVRGFSLVETKDPDLTGFPPGLVYVFTCPWERTKVAISATTGALSWTESF